jgi:hypothetical protein
MTRETSLALRVGVPVTAGVVLLVAAWLLRTPAAPKPKLVEPPSDHEIGCVLPAAAPMPTSDDYGKLAACLETWNATRQVGMNAVSVADVKHWVEDEHDPVWLEKGAWWFPLSGEGEEHYPSGLYISVPLDGSACGGAIVN